MNKKEKYIRSIKPYPPQEAFFSASARRIAYGGARGGGKSYAMRTKLILLALNMAGIQILLLRRTFPELRENHINPMRKLLFGIAVYKDTTKEFVFPNSSRIKLGYLADDGDVLQYQGQSYDCVAMEESTQFTELQYLAMTECCRVSGCMREHFVPRMYFTCNPGGVGHQWMKRLFIDRDYRQGEDPDDYVFIRSTVYDNEFIIKNNPEYIKTLQSLPPIRRKAMLDGDWNAFEGQFFPEFSYEAHVCKPFDIPSDWTRFAAFDYGLDMTACLWFCYPPDRRHIYVYREFCRPDLIVSEAASEISRLSRGERIKYYSASPDLAGRRQESGCSGFDLMAKAGLRGIVSANNERINGWRRVREYLKYSEDGIKMPILQIFASCTDLIRSIPALLFDKVKTEDASVHPHEFTHSTDALRYGIMSLPLFSSEKEKNEKSRKRSVEEDFFGVSSRHESYFDFLKR
ncbi:MAG: hypothetical protein E7665_05525 [Ruminococcaceae bacterium]|nr:hypothetical protein [Oscillospiraceae bacterium]